MESPDDLQRFRPFLRALAEEQLYSGLRPKMDPSDLVQQTMLQAVESQSQFRGTTDAAKASWLRSILKNVMAGFGRHFHRDRRPNPGKVSKLLGISAARRSSYARVKIGKSYRN